MMTTNVHPPLTDDVVARRPSRTTTAAVVLVGAVLPALAGIVLLGSVAVGRPLLGRWFPGGRAGGPDRTQPSRSVSAGPLTLVWAVGLLLAGALQAVGAATGGGSIMDPTGFVARAAVGLGVEAILLVVSVRWPAVRAARAGARARRP
jgi:hypothetical protein